MLFSVIVPIYKVEEYLRKCVDSILIQSLSDFEVILVDDGSPDHCPEICDQYAQKDSRVKVVHKPNGGLASARNAGLKVASGEYVIYVDGDDWISEDMLDGFYQKILKPHPDVDAIVSGMTWEYGDRTELTIPYIDKGYYGKERLQEEVYPYLMYDSRKPFYTGAIFPSSGGKVFRLSLLKEHYCRDERIRMGEDNAFIFECIYFAKAAYVSRDGYYHYNRKNEGSITQSYDKERFRNNKLLTSYISEHLGGLTEEMDRQINAFKAYWLIMAVFHEVKTHQSMKWSSRHIREEIRATNALEEISLNGLPLQAQCFLLLLRMHFYRLALIGARLINSLRNGS